MKYLLLSLALASAAHAADSSLEFRTWAPTPPMGWNSWDCFATTVTEEQTKAQADYMADKLKSHGWEYIVVDIQWYEPGAKDHGYRTDAVLVMDDYGRLQPAVNRFPSAANGAGFKALADYIHSRGLKFGIHLMRGIPRQAVDKNLPVKGTSYRAQDIADKNSICPWNPDMYGVDMAKPGAQEYYNSVFEMIAGWGVDYVKVDDIARPYQEHAPEIEAVRKAIDATGRPMVLSLSPGETALDAAAHVKRHANLWRISDDFWDRWGSLYEQFARMEKWNPHRGPGTWPDADMLPFGVLVQGTRSTRFTPDEQRTVMTLWAIGRSPLMHGGDMTKTDEFTYSLLTNDEVIAINQRSTNNRPLFNRDQLIAWTADVPNSADKYLAVFNARDRVRLTPEHVHYRSGLVTRDPATSAQIDVDVTGGTKLYLVADMTPDGNVGDNALWIDPKIVLADGSEQSLVDLEWTKADAQWDSAATTKAPRGREFSHRGQPIASGIGALAGAVIEYPLPANAVRFKALGAVNDADGGKEGGGTLQFMVGVATPKTESSLSTLPVTVEFKDLGLDGTVRVQDLWAHGDLGKMTGQFSPEIAWHGAGLYRISPVAGR